MYIYIQFANDRWQRTYRVNGRQRYRAFSRLRLRSVVRMRYIHSARLSLVCVNIYIRRQRYMRVVLPRIVTIPMRSNGVSAARSDECGSAVSGGIYI